MVDDMSLRVGRRGVLLATAGVLAGCATPRPENVPPAGESPAPASAPVASPSPTAGVREVPAGLRGQAEALTAGGVVLYLRHPATTRGGTDSPDWPRERQRLLSAEGEQQARDLGAAFQAHGWTVHEVLSSPSWRCRDAAQIAIGDYRAATGASVSEGAGVITGIDDTGEVRVLGIIDAQGWAALAQV